MYYLLQLISKASLFAFLALAMTACTEPKQIRNVRVQIGGSAKPEMFIRSSDGGFFLSVESAGATILKLSATGSVEWKFIEPSAADSMPSVNMIAGLSDGGAIICGGRSTLAPDFTVLPGFFIHLDSHGREIDRLDPTKTGFAGQNFYDVMACSSWNGGYVMSALYAANPDRPGGFNRFDNVLTKITRVSSDMHQLWSIPADVGGLGLPVRMSPVELKTKSILFPGAHHIYVINLDGSIAAEKSIGNCRAVRVAQPADDTQFVCAEGNDYRTVHIYKFGPRLESLGTNLLQGYGGLPFVALSAEGQYFLGANRGGSAGPRVGAFNEAGKLMGDIELAGGLLKEMLPDGRGVAVMYVVSDQGYPTPMISWINN